MRDHGSLDLSVGQYALWTRFLFSDGRTLAVKSYHHQAAREAALVWARDTSGLTGKELDRVKIEGSASIDGPASMEELLEHERGTAKSEVVS